MLKLTFLPPVTKQAIEILFFSKILGLIDFFLFFGIYRTFFSA